MMHYIVIFIFSGLFAFSCAKPSTKNPVPHIEWIDLTDEGKSSFTKSDTAVMVLSYEDGDGDLFVNSTNDDNNLVFTPYKYDDVSGKFIIQKRFTDTIRITHIITQPDNGYYKGKSIRGQIHIPLGQFRESDKIKIIKFEGFMIDMKKHKSNQVSSPVYTLNF